MEKLRPIKGTQSLYGEAADRFAHVVATFEEVRRLYGFARVEVPMFEQTGVFARTMGETSDVVSKEMWSFESRSEGSVTLRPEFTAGIARAYLSEGWKQYAPMKVATHGAAFRYERPQKGRYRQFHQLDAEVLGSADPMADVELLCFGAQLLDELGIEGVRLKLNTLGDAQSRDRWRAALIEHFAAHHDELSEDSQARLEKNPLRILDSKDPRDRPFADSAPKMVLSAEAEDFFGQVKAGLDAAGVAYELDPHLVRGLDYYRHTAFEFVTDQLGAQGTVLAGGRYDGLIEQLGGPPTPAVGWAAGIERLAMLVDDEVRAGIEAAVLPMGEEARPHAIRAAQLLRGAGIATEIFWSGKMAKRMSRADAAGAGAALIIGEEEIAAGTVQYKDLKTGEQRQLTVEETVEPITDIAAEAMLAEWSQEEQA
ncbi:histidine--tRNA ligase [Sphingomicrobium astaxanthinifaciens]|uniref:histidine--tRNA ligase n=1 Tax=Sphingomicrobium astaxanthinifaciens TaxID=1227949 RepID=UPI001FCB77E3|nr:histidine--tRNA ligase [Sphingomicrobium astaxanthinifaciens]MCJ7421085.1 histidine--tRNA ligase [Sphingomicrobium astaxanthinifaciens]